MQYMNGWGLYNYSNIETEGRGMAEVDDIGQRKPLLTVEEQIEHLRSKGVAFELCSE